MNPGASTTTAVEMDSVLLSELRQRNPGKNDRALLEDIAKIELGFETLAEVQQRNSLDPEEARLLALRAVNESRADAA